MSYKIQYKICIDMFYKPHKTAISSKDIFCIEKALNRCKCSIFKAFPAVRRMGLEPDMQPLNVA